MQAIGLVTLLIGVYNFLEYSESIRTDSANPDTGGDIYFLASFPHRIGYVVVGYNGELVYTARKAAYLSLKLCNRRELDDSVLVDRVRNGDHRAFSELVRRHQSVVYRSCYRILGNREDAKDASQEAFLRAYRKLDTFQGRSVFRTWILRVAMNVSLNERDRRKLPRADAASAESLPSLEAPEAELMKSEAVAEIHKALQLVRSNHRAAIVLRDLEGLTYQETAESLGIPEGTAKSWVYRGRERLKELLVA